MLYLHCGWPKTGTTSLQATLTKQQNRLAGMGILYPEKWKRPERWKPNGSDNHRGIEEAMKASRTSEGAYDELIGFLRMHSDSDVVLSSESLTIWLLRDDLYEGLRQFLAAIAEATPLTCVWTLRRFDAVVHSQYLHLAREGKELPSMATYMNIKPDEVFARMCEIERMLGGRSTYIKYSSSGEHVIEALRAFGIPSNTVNAIRHDSRNDPRRNVTLSQKQTAAAMNLGILEEHLGTRLDRGLLLEAFADGKLSFDDDRPCELAGEAVRRRLHERALDSARRCGFNAYLEFFSNAEVKVDSEVVGTNPSVLSEEDLRRLVSRCALPIEPGERIPG